MALQSLAATQQSLSSPVLPGTWKLGTGRAITLNPREDAVLRIAHGRVWVTFDTRQAGPGNELGDYFLSAGEEITVQGGQRAVVESFGSAPQESAYFSWDALPMAVRSPVRVASRWQLSVVQPLVDLRLALGLAGGALGRLAFGLGGVVTDLLPARADRGFSRAFSAQPSATRPHCAMS
ncbi:MAG: DUF2917 domain-containing protein [Comamonadaceae bacterium]|nr:MAG: DUF2917 domain-containing protein [Comamonadaceae bacterium]